MKNASRKKVPLEKLDLESLKRFSKMIDKDVFKAIDAARMTRLAGGIAAGSERKLRAWQKKLNS